MGSISENDVIEVMAKALKVDGKKLTMESAAGDPEQWDSLGHLSILSALDKYFGGKVASLRDLATADSVKGIIKILKDNSLV